MGRAVHSYKALGEMHFHVTELSENKYLSLLTLKLPIVTMKVDLIY